GARSGTPRRPPRGEPAAMAHRARREPIRHNSLGSWVRAICALVVGAAIGLLLTASRASAAPVDDDGVVTRAPLVFSAPRPAPSPTHGVWPLRPRPPVVAGFHPPASRFGAGHRGVDLAGTVGQVVRT